MGGWEHNRWGYSEIKKDQKTGIKKRVDFRWCVRVKSRTEIDDACKNYWLRCEWPVAFSKANHFLTSARQWCVKTDNGWFNTLIHRGGLPWIPSLIFERASCFQGCMRTISIQDRRAILEGPRASVQIVFVPACIILKYIKQILDGKFYHLTLHKKNKKIKAFWNTICKFEK